MKILLVDDSATMRKIVENILVSLGYAEPVKADCGEAAIELLKRHDDIDLVLLDWNMPMMDGLTCLKNIRANDATRDLPVIMVTSETTKSRIVEAIQAGATNYLLKPFDADGLKKVIDASLV